MAYRSTSIAPLLKTRPLARSSLGLGFGGTALAFFVALVAFEALLHVLGWPASRGRRGPEGALIALATTAWCAAWVVAAHALVRRAARRFIEELALPLDRAEYLDALDQRSRTARLCVEVHFKDSAVRWPAEVLPPSGSIEIEPGVTRIISPVRTTITLSMYSLWYYNRSLHVWFRRLAEETLASVDASSPIRSVTVTRLDASPLRTRRAHRSRPSPARRA